MIDLEHLRNNADLYKKAAARKRISLDVDQLLAAETRVRTLRQELDQLRALRNQLTEQVAKGAHKTKVGSVQAQDDAHKTKEGADQAQDDGDKTKDAAGTAGGAQIDREKLIDQSRTIGEELVAKQALFAAAEAQFGAMVALVPGLPCQGVPDGASDDDNVELSRWGEPRQFDFAPRDHMAIAALHNMVDQEGARLIAGSRAYALKGDGALLEMAVLRFALDTVMARGMTPVLPPLMVKENAMFGTGYFPMGEENAYEITKDKLYLTGTSEVGMAAMYMGQTLDLDQLPIRLAGMTPCFRREAGSAGRDVKGLYRVHQFQKVEQVVICAGDEQISLAEHGALLQNAEDILRALELPYRVVAVCAGEMGLGQVRKHDIETWMPSREAYGETHSCSSFHDFQARRLGLRYRDGEGRKLYVHTLNNTAIASPRILIALLENHQQPDGSIYIPPALRPYLGGRKLIEPGVKS